MLIRNDQSSSRETLNQPLHRNQRLDSSESTDTNNQSTDAKIPDGAKITPLSVTLLYYHCLVICNKCQHIRGSEFCWIVLTHHVSMFPCNFSWPFWCRKGFNIFIFEIYIDLVVIPFYMYQFITVSVVMYTCIWL